jgi:hypothetical protein
VPASIGGLARGNTSRDMKRGVVCKATIPELYDVEVPIYVSKHSAVPGVCKSMQPVVLPHEFIGWMFDIHRDKFDKYVLGNKTSDNIANFWRSFQPDDDLVWDHPCFSGADPDFGHICPIGTHSDGVPVTKPGAGSMSLLVTSFSSPFSSAKTSDSHWIFSAIPSPIVVKYKEGRGNATLEGHLEVLNWSMACLNSGKYPTTDHQGNPWAPDSVRSRLANQSIAGSWKFCNWQHRGDLDMVCNELQMAHWSCTNPCGRCPCTKDGENCFLDFRPAAAWKAASWTNSTWEAPESEFWKGPGVRMRTYALDPAHTLDKGMTQNILGSLFKELVYGRELAPNTTVLDNQVVILNMLLNDFYERQSCSDRVERIRIKDFVKNPKSPNVDFPIFTAGNMTKCRRLLPFGLSLARDFNDGSPHDVHRLELFKSFDAVYEQIYHGPDFFTDSEVALLQRNIDRVLAHQNWLHTHAADNGFKHYNVTIKSHMLWHMGRDAKYYNPRFGWTYNDEDFVGKIASLCRSVTRSVANQSRGQKLLEKWLLAMHCSWSAPAASFVSAPRR